MSDDNIQVAVRVRPLLKREIKSKLTPHWIVNGKELYLDDPLNREELFTFDYIHDVQSTNVDIYELVQPLVASTLIGFNATIFAYGQTSSGKTHSILGNDSDPGIIPRSATSIFTEIARQSNVNKYVVKLSYIEIYNEKIVDLLNLKNVDMKFSVAEDRKSSVLVGMHEEIIHNEKELMEFISKGNKNRQIGDTLMNERSSRSHVICDIFIECAALEECENGEIDADTPVKAGHLYIVDLAGSERIAQTGATGARLNEGVHINKSLSALIAVITALGNGQSHVGFRNSKLTMYLNTALGGNSRTLMLATITPASIEDSMSTLRFARSAKNIKTKPKLNELVSQQSLIKRREEEVKQMRERIKILEEQITKSACIYVPFRELKPRKNQRRYTMAASTELHGMEPISEDADQEEGADVNHQPPSERYRDVLQRLSQPLSLPLTMTATTETSKESSHTCNCQGEEYNDLMTQFNLLNQSHVSLKEFTKTEFDLRLQEETDELRKERDALLLEKEGYEKEIQSLMENYENLNMSHFQLQEFTKIEKDVAAEEQNKILTLQRECELFKERMEIMQSERELTENTQTKQLRRRCDELLARITELENKKLNDTRLETIIETIEPQEPTDADIINAELQTRCKKLEDDIKLIEMHSKVLQHENNVLKARKKELTRSYSDTNLAALSEHGVVDETTKEDFQGIYKGMRMLTSAIISDGDANDLMLGATPLKLLTPQRRGCPNRKSHVTHRQSFTDRMAGGIRDEEEDELRQENAMLKEHTHELLLKLKMLNDKFNERDTSSANMDVGSLEEKITKLRLRNEELEHHLHKQNGDGNKFTSDNYCQELEDKITKLEAELRECETLGSDYQIAQNKIQELTKELNDVRVPNDALPNQNSVFIEELREKLKIGNKLHQEKEKQIKELEQQLSKMIQRFTDSHKDYENGLQGQMQNVSTNESSKLETIEELRQKLTLKEDEFIKLQEEFKQKQHEHNMDKESLEYYSTELDEAMSKIKELQADIKALKSSHLQFRNELIHELDVYKKEKVRLEKDLENAVMIEEKYAKVQVSLVEKTNELQQSQSKLTSAMEELQDYQLKLEVSNKEADIARNELKELQAMMDAIEKAKEQNKLKLSKLSAVLKEKEKSMAELQQKHDETVQEWEKKHSTMQVEHDHSEHEMIVKEKEFASILNANNEKIAEMQGLLNDKDQKITDLQTALSAENAIEKITKSEHEALISQLQHVLEITKLESEYAKNAAAVVQDEISALKSTKEDLTEKIVELKSQIQHAKSQQLLQNKALLDYEANETEKNILVASLQEKLAITIQSLEKHKIASDDTRKQLQHEILSKDSLLKELKERITELQDEIDNITSADAENKEKLSMFQVQIAEKDELLKKLLAQQEEEHKLEKDMLTQRIAELEDSMGNVKQQHEHYTEKLSMLQNLVSDKDALLKEKETIYENECKTLTNKMNAVQANLCSLKEETHKTEILLKSEIATLTEELTLRKNTDNLSCITELKQIDEKYQNSVTLINALQTELEVTRKSHERMQRIEVTHKSVIARSASMPPEARIQFLSDELRKNRIENIMNRDNLADIKRKYEMILKEKANWTETPKKEPPPADHIPEFVLKKMYASKVKAAEAKLAESSEKCKRAEEQINTLSEKEKAAQLVIQELKNDLVSARHAAKKTSEGLECECATLRQKYLKLQLEHEQFVANNQANFNVEAREISDLKSQLDATRKLYERQITTMTEDYDRKCQAYSEKHSQLKKATEESIRIKDAAIKDLQARLDQGYKENTETPPLITGKLLSDANQLDTTSALKLKIFDLQKQVQAARAESAHRGQQYEKQVDLLRQDYQEKIAAMQKKAEPKKLVAMNISKSKECFLRRIDLELVSVPVKMSILKKITSVEALADPCLQCVRRRHCLTTLKDTCVAHRTWRQLDSDATIAQIARDFVRTERFEELSNIRDFYAKLLQHQIGDDTRDMITFQLENATRDINDYEKNLREKNTFLKFIHTELKNFIRKITEETPKDTKDECDHCPLFALCCKILGSLTEEINCSVIILEQLGDRLNPIQFVLDDSKAWQEKLDKLMTDFGAQINVRKDSKEKLLYMKKYRIAKNLADIRYRDLKILEAFLNTEGFIVDYKSDPIRVLKNSACLPSNKVSVDEDNPRPSIGKTRDSGRKSLGATPKHFSPFFVTPDEHRVDKSAARRHK